MKSSVAACIVALLTMATAVSSQAPPYDVLSADELDELVAGLEPIAAADRTPSS